MACMAKQHTRREGDEERHRREASCTGEERSTKFQKKKTRAKRGEKVSETDGERIPETKAGGKMRARRAKLRGERKQIHKARTKRKSERKLRKIRKGQRAGE